MLNELHPVQASPVPLYVQVENMLRQRIADGTFAPHTQLPSESEMSAIFGVSRITVRQALSDLQRDGVIFKMAGKGSFVAKPKAAQTLVKLEGFAEAMAPKGFDIYNIVMSHETVTANDEVACRLGLSPASAVTEIQRVRHLNGAPISFETTYLPEAVGERLRTADLARRDIFLILENDLGLNLGHADLEIGATNANAALAAALQVELNAPLLRIERLTYTDTRSPLDFEYLYFRAEDFQYHLTIERRPKR